MKKMEKTKQPPAPSAPPNDPELEAVTLGAMMLEQGAEIPILTITDEDTFYDERNRLVFRAIRQLSEDNSPIDIYTVVDQLHKNGDLDTVGGAYYVASLTEKIGSAAHSEFHARILQQKAILRQLLTISQEIQHRATDPTADINELLTYSEQSIYNLATSGVRQEIQDSDTILADCTKRLQELADRLASDPGSLSGVPSGFGDLDRITNGFQKSHLIILAGRPAMGKTAFILSMAKNIVQTYAIPTLIFSLEMSRQELMDRIICMQTLIPGDKMQSGRLDSNDWARYDAEISRLQNLPLYIDDTAAISLFELRAKAIRAKAEHNIRCIMIDYLQLMTTGNSNFKGNREQEVSTISRGLKQIAKELDLPIIVLSQLSRAAQQTGDPTPKLHHLRDSGAIEQDADIVAFVHRPEYYDIMQDENGESTQGIAQIIIAKNRHGAIDTIRLAFRAEYTLFENLNTF